MAFTKKTWKDRIAQYLNRRRLTDVDTGDIKTVTVTRDEGGITEEGDIFNAATMNDLENRINNAFTEVNAKTGSDIPVSSGETETIAEMLTTQFVNNFVTLAGSAALNDNQCSIYGKIHSLRLYFTAVNAGSGWVTQATVPEGHRPSGIMEFYLVNEAGGFNNAECRITTDGLLQVYSPTSNMKLWGQGWWISA